MAIFNMGVGTHGEDGVSPIVTLTRKEASIAVTVVDAEGEKSAELYDGARGEQGATGNDGADGVTPHIGDDGYWYLGDTSTGVKAQGVDGADGLDNLPNVEEVEGAEVALTMAHNVEYRCVDAVTSLTISGFAYAESDKASLWAIQFTAGSEISVTVPDAVVWAIAAPVWTAGVTYWLSFVPLITGKILGVWVSDE